MSKFRSLVGAFILFPLFVSCGKQDLLTNVDREVRKGMSNGVTVLHKGFIDGVNTTSKAISDSNETIKKGLTDVKNEADSGLTKSKQFADETLTNSRNFAEKGSHDIVYNGGKFIESVGQIPRNIGNKLLGTSEDSDENISDLQKELDILYAEFYEAIAELNQDMDDMKIELQGENQALQDVVDNGHTSLLRQIRQGDRRNLRKIRRLRQNVRRLRQNVRTIRRNVNNLEVVCEYDDFLWSVDFATYCELERNRNR